ncbi:MAG: hypothetical protein GY816_03335 [Cytophagales bacterium]|nr:hypothetical protein [Cytophagales bacterium]
MSNQDFFSTLSMSIFKTWTDFHNRLNLIFHSIVAVTMLPFVWLFLEIDGNGREGVIDDTFVVVLFLLVCTSLTGTAFMYKKKQLEEVKNKPHLRTKLESYLHVLIVNYALLEGAALFATLAFYLTANYIFVVAYIFILFLFSLSRPNLERASRELFLSKDEREILANREEIVK